MSPLQSLFRPAKDFAGALSRLPGGRKQAVIMVYDAAAMLLALWLGFCIRFGEPYWPTDPWIFLLIIGSVVLGLAALAGLGVYRVVIRYLDVRTPSRLAIGAAAAAAIWFVLAYLTRIDSVPRTVGFIYFGLLYLLMFFGRLGAASVLGAVPVDAAPVRRGTRAKEIGVAIHGANAAGASLAESLRRHPEYRLRFLVDDNPELTGRTMAGHKIRSTDYLRAAVSSGKVEQVFLAMPSVSRAERIAALGKLRDMAVKVLTVPSYEEIMSGRYAISDVRPIRAEDLLKRNVVPPLKHLIEGGIRGKSVLVTGAGGSIGSEICRQTIQHRPRRLVLFEHSEFALYAIEAELAGLCEQLDLPPIEIVPVIGSLLNERLLARTLKQCETDTVFHAAAYKHVPLLEQNEVVGVENNVIGTRRLADACVAAGVRRVTMISTDKAVRPTNVMGASKRVAELYIQALARRPDLGTAFGIVRFGNVLDSSGSVVQQFRRQIRAGGPVTVTHEEITRFFMSIPEATQLVLQANSLASRGEVFVLDMGEPVKIVELARTMIAISGLTERNADNPDGDIEICFVGLRPGEKLYEELFIGDDISDTEHPQIKMAQEQFVPFDQLMPIVTSLESAIADQNPVMVRELLRSLLAMDHRIAA